MDSYDKIYLPVHKLILHILVFIIKMPIITYRHTFSYFVGHNCRFYPTCSSYSLEAINSHGVMEGIILSIKRLARCHPWSNHSGVDPVPSPHRK